MLRFHVFAIACSLLYFSGCGEAPDDFDETVIVAARLDNIELSWNYERVLSNLNTISVMIYQELTTDIKGNPN